MKFLSALNEQIFRQIKNLISQINRFSTSDVNLRPTGRYKIQLFLEDKTWSASYNIPKMIDIVIHQLSGRN